MSESAKGRSMYGTLSAVAELNKVAGFNPLKFIRKVLTAEDRQERLYLDLKYKKLWFRLKYPQGRIKLSPLKITEQFAIIEAKVFFDKDDSVPAASFTAQRNAKTTPGGLYIEAAQHAAVDQALFDAGFGLQFADVSSGADKEPYDSGIPASGIGKTVMETTAGTAAEQPAPEQTPAPAQTPQGVSETTAEPPATPPAREIPAEPTVMATSMEDTSAQGSPLVVEASAIQTADAQEDVQQEPAGEPAPIVEEQPPEEEEAPAEEPVADAPVETIEEGPAPRYTADMPVDEICSLMTLHEAQDIIVDIGTCNGWTLQQVAERRAASLKWYLNGYSGDNNILRAGARLLLENMSMAKAS